MIEGLELKNLKSHGDIRGNFIEILRADEGMLEKIAQVSISETNPGLIKAFHWHRDQDDIFYVLDGKINLVLHDPRENSKTKNKTQNMVLDKESLLILKIPRGVFHGYKVLGTKPARVLYMMNNEYNPLKPDEHRVDFNDPKINYDWDSIK